MYQGTLEPVSNRADWFLSIELVDDSTNTPLTDLSDITFNLQVRSVPPEGREGRRSPLNNYYDYFGYQGQTILKAVSGDTHTTVTGGVVQFHFTAQEMSRLYQGAYDVGLTATRDGVVEQEMIVTLPIVDGVVRP